MKNNKIKLATISILVILLASTAFFILHLNSFRIVSIKPENGIIPTSVIDIIIETSKPIDPNTTVNDSVVLEPSLDSDISIEGSIITIRLASNIDDGEELIINLELVSEDGDELITSLVFEGAFTPASEIPEELRVRPVKESDSFENDYPLLTRLPYYDREFEVDFRFPNSGEERMPVIITSLINTVPRPSESTPRDSDLYREYITQLRRTRTEAIDFVKSLEEFDEDRYTLYVNEPFLLDEFNVRLY